MEWKWSGIALLLVGIVTAGAASAFGHFNDNGAREAIATGDYDAWVSANEQMQPELTTQMFQEQVDRFNKKQAIELAIENKDYDAWLAAVDETGSSNEFEMLVERHNKRNAVENALIAQNYDAWVQAQNDLMPSLSQEEFDARQQRFAAHQAVHEAVQAQDYESYVTAAQDANLPILSEDDFTQAGNMRMMGRGWHR